MRSLGMHLVLAMSALPTGSTQDKVDRYVVDASRSHIGFTVRHMMVTDVKGKFNEFSGEIHLNEKDITQSWAHVTIETASLDTDNERRDNHLRSDDFFNARQYPEIVFRTTRVQKRGNELALIGDLTIRNVTRQVPIPFTITGPAKDRERKRSRFSGSLTIDRFDYGLKYNRMAEAVQVVAPAVRIDLSIHAVTPGQ